jgi:hypothetical protein
MYASSGEKKGTYLSWNSSLENRRLQCLHYRLLLCKERILTPAGVLLVLTEMYEGFRTYVMQESELVVSPPCSVILVTTIIIVIMLSCHPCCCHHPIDSYSIRRRRFIWTPDTHTHARTHTHTWAGEITEGQRGPHTRYWTNYQTL